MVGFLFFIWWLVGVVGFVYWWTSTCDLTAGTLVFSFLAGFMGPLAWVCGYHIHGRNGRPLVIMKARK